MWNKNTPELLQLLERARAGDVAARNEVIEQHVEFMRMLINKYLCPIRHGERTSSYLGEATIGLIRAINRYDPAAGASFTTFASFCVRGALLDFKRLDHLIHARTSNKTSEGLRQKAARAHSCGPIDLHKGSLQAALSMDEELECWCLSEHLTTPQKYLLEKLRAGCQQKDIAEDYGCSASAVSIMVKDLRKTVEAFMQRDAAKDCAAVT